MDIGLVDRPIGTDEASDTGRSCEAVPDERSALSQSAVMLTSSRAWTSIPLRFRQKVAIAAGHTGEREVRVTQSIAQQSVERFIAELRNGGRADLTTRSIHPLYAVDGEFAGPDWVAAKVMRFRSASTRKLTLDTLLELID